MDSKSRGVNIRCVTEIGENNLSYCKELMNITSELRHLEGVRPNFMISEREYLLTPLGLLEGNRQEEEQLTQHIVYNDLKELVD